MENKTPKQKKPVRKVKAMSSDVPQGPTGGFRDEMESTCGHGACTGGKCKVRYVGPVTQIRDHHIVHASRHASHIWSAAIVSGLAVVLTGAIGYAAFGADATNPGGTLYGEFQQLNQRLDKIDSEIQTLLDRTQPTLTQAGPKPSELNQMATSTQPEGQSADACVQNCTQAYPDDAQKASQCAAERCGAATGGQQTQDQCLAQCKKDNPDNADAINTCFKTKCSQPAATEQPTADQCKQQCTQKYANQDLTADQKAANTQSCIDRNCGTTQTPPVVIDQCTQNCKDKYKDNQASINTCIVENKCPGYQTLTPPSNNPAAGQSVTTCQTKCSTTRASCVKEAGTNVLAMRTCYTKESSCKTACGK